MKFVREVAEMGELVWGECVVGCRGDMRTKLEQSGVEVGNVWVRLGSGEVGDKTVVIRVDVWDGQRADDFGAENIRSEVVEVWMNQLEVVRAECMGVATIRRRRTRGARGAAVAKCGFGATVNGANT